LSRAVIGLTGGLGSGKSTVLSLLRKKGAFTWDADAAVRRALSSGQVLAKIRRLFGDDVFRGKKLDRRRLAQIVFSSLKDRRRLESVLHPRVRRECRLTLRRQKAEIAVCDVPLLYETGNRYGFKKVIVVDAPLGVRLKRLKGRGFSPAEAQARIKAQWPLSKKVKKADFVIRNGGSIQKTKAQVDRIWADLIKK
jgi:dephospho-CoA kinase